MSAYSDELQRLMAAGWTPDQGIPESLMQFAGGGGPEGSGGAPPPGAAPQSGPALGGAGTMDDPMQLSTMMVQGDPMGGAPQPGAAPQAGDAPPRPGVFEGMSDEDADQYAGMGDLKRQMEVAEGLRGTADAEGQSVNQGRTFVAANPLEHLSVGVRRWKGAKDAKRLGKEQTKGRRSFVDLLRNRDKDDFSETEVDYQFDPDSSERYA